MAKRKKAAAPRRRIGNTGMGTAVQLFGGAVLGGIIARAGGVKLAGEGKTLTPQMYSIACAGGGAMIMNMAKTPLFKGVGIGVGVEGATGLMRSMKLISGVDDSYDGLGAAAPGAWDQLDTMAGMEDEEYI